MVSGWPHAACETAATTTFAKNFPKVATVVSPSGGLGMTTALTIRMQLRLVKALATSNRVTCSSANSAPCVRSDCHAGDRFGLFVGACSAHLTQERITKVLLFPAGCTKFKCLVFELYMGCVWPIWFLSIVTYVIFQLRSMNSIVASVSWLDWPVTCEQLKHLCTCFKIENIELVISRPR